MKTRQWNRKNSNKKTHKKYLFDEYCGFVPFFIRQSSSKNIRMHFVLFIQNIYPAIVCVPFQHLGIWLRLNAINWVWFPSLIGVCVHIINVIVCVCVRYIPIFVTVFGIRKILLLAISLNIYDHSQINAILCNIK